MDEQENSPHNKQTVPTSVLTRITPETTGDAVVRRVDEEHRSDDRGSGPTTFETGRPEDPFKLPKFSPPDNSPSEQSKN